MMNEMMKYQVQMHRKLIATSSRAATNRNRLAPIERRPAYHGRDDTLNGNHNQ